MKKMTLDLDQLNVDSFSTTAREPLKWGTVRGHGSSELEPCWGGSDETESGGAQCLCMPITLGGEACGSGPNVCYVECTEGSCGPETCGSPCGAEIFG
jgi:hypothetical protein